MQERWDAGLEGCRDSGDERYRKEWIQEKKDSGMKGYRKGDKQGRKDEGQEEAVKKGSRIGGMQGMSGGGRWRGGGAPLPSTRAPATAHAINKKN